MFFNSKKPSRSNRSKTKSYRPGLESLEERRVMATTGVTTALVGTVLTVTGTEKADNINVKQDGTKLSVYDDTKVVGTYTTGAKLTSITVNSKGGHDSVDLANFSGYVVKIPATINGGAGNDYLAGGNGGDTINGEGGADTLVGKGGKDTLSGGDNVDTIYGGEQDDLIYGGAGNDWLYGDAGVDRIYGEADNDYLNGGVDRDKLFGGSGVDTFRRNMKLGSALTTYSDGQLDDDIDDGFAAVTNKTPAADDMFAINQAQTPTCAFLSSLAEISQWTGKFSNFSRNGDLLKNLSYDAAWDLYTVKLYVNGSAKSVTVNSDWTEGDPDGALWVTLYQKAYLRAMDVVYQQADNSRLPDDEWKSTSNQAWQNPGNAMQMITGYTSSKFDISTIDPQKVKEQMAKGYTYVFSTKGSGVSSTFVAQHAYAVQSVFKQGNDWMITLYNPWGHDGKGAATDGKDDGLVTVKWTTMKANFDHGYVN